MLNKKTFPYFTSFGIALGVFIISFIFIWLIGFTSGERTWAKNIIVNKFKK